VNISAAGLLQEVERRCKELSTFRNEQQKAYRETTVPYRALEELENQIRKDGKLMKMLMRENTMLQGNAKRQAIIAESEKKDDESMDLILINSFRELRALIQDIVHKYYTMIPGTRPKWHTTNANPLLTEQEAFFEGPVFQSHMPEWMRKFYVRAKLFDIFIGSSQGLILGSIRRWKRASESLRLLCGLG
jgi:hypothetical protein